MHIHDQKRDTSRAAANSNQEKEQDQVFSGLLPPGLQLTASSPPDDDPSNPAENNQTALLQLRKDEQAVQKYDQPFTIEENPSREELSVREIATDTFRTARAIIHNFDTALNNFETAISNESAQEAAPADAASIVLREVVSFVTSGIQNSITSFAPGGSFINSIIGLGQSIERAIQQERTRSSRAANRNLAANFVINSRTIVSNTYAALESQMTEGIATAVRRHDSASSPTAQSAIRQSYEMANHQMTRRLNGPFSADGLFVKISELWINSTNSPSSSGRSVRASKLYIHLNRDWELISAHVDSPFGSRIAEQLTNVAGRSQDGVSLVNFDVPRQLIWYPLSTTRDFTCEIRADLPPEGNSLNNTRPNGRAARYVNQFIQNVRTRPIPNARTFSGAQV